MSWSNEFIRYTQRHIWRRNSCIRSTVPFTPRYRGILYTKSGRIRIIEVSLPCTLRLYGQFFERHSRGEQPIDHDRSVMKLPRATNKDGIGEICSHEVKYYPVRQAEGSNGVQLTCFSALASSNKNMFFDRTAHDIRRKTKSGIFSCV